MCRQKFKLTPTSVRRALHRQSPHSQHHCCHSWHGQCHSFGASSRNLQLETLLEKRTALLHLSRLPDRYMSYANFEKWSDLYLASSEAWITGELVHRKIRVCCAQYDGMAGLCVGWNTGDARWGFLPPLLIVQQIRKVGTKVHPTLKSAASRSCPTVRNRDLPHYSQQIAASANHERAPDFSYRCVAPFFSHHELYL